MIVARSYDGFGCDVSGKRNSLEVAPWLVDLLIRDLKDTWGFIITFVWRMKGPIYAFEIWRCFDFFTVFDDPSKACSKATMRMTIRCIGAELLDTFSLSMSTNARSTVRKGEIISRLPPKVIHCTRLISIQ